MTTENTEQMDEKLVQMVAALTIEAALAMTGPENNLLPPTFGWMVPPATGAPEVEMGAALAVHALIRSLDLDREDVEHIARTLRAEASK